MNRNQLTKETFLIQLEHLLYDIPKEERDEAMDYYRSYFDDAGEENEAAVLEELDAPRAVAAIIREELHAPGNRTGFLKNPPQVRESQAQSAFGAQQGGQAQSRAQEYSGQSENCGPDAAKTFSSADFQKADGGASSEQESFERASSERAAYKRYQQYDSENRRARKAGHMDKHTKLFLFVILAVFTSPVWGTAASGLFGAVGVIIAAVIALGICSVGGAVGGAVCAVTGIVRICMLSIAQGLSLLGIGMLLIAASGLGIVALLLLCGRFLPWMVGQVAGLFRRLWKWGRSMA